MTDGKSQFEGVLVIDVDRRFLTADGAESSLGVKQPLEVLAIDAVAASQMIEAAPLPVLRSIEPSHLVVAGTAVGANPIPGGAVPHELVQRFAKTASGATLHWPPFCT